MAIPRTPEEVSQFEFRGIYGLPALLRWERAGDVNQRLRAEGLRQRAELRRREGATETQDATVHEQGADANTPDD